MLGRVKSKSSQSQSHIAADGQSISKSWCRAPSGAHDQIFITVWQLRSCFCGARSLNWGRVCLLYMFLALARVVFLGSESLGTRGHILLSQIWLGRVSQSQSHIATDGQSACLSVLVSSPVWGSWPDINYCLTVTLLSLGRRPLWREDGSVVYQSAGSIRSIVSMYNFYILHVSHVMEYIYNIYKASVSPGLVQQIMPYFW
jgi:hypothetical protein